ncbi:hypothetical protein KP509_1Z151300 [Ceratopteris richardii]|nr:hypothetical protein KP509_1Z151300 [Ceratopteris richardii]
MALSNFIMTVLGVGAVWMLVRTDLRQSSSTLSRNIRHVRSWLEKEAAASSSEAGKLKPKELDKPPTGESTAKDEKP